jgi:FkbM family methyltransferase
VIPTDLIRANSVVYSGGVGEDVSFDLELIARAGCEVWAFDPTPRSIDFARRVHEERFHFLPIGLWSTDGPRRFYAPADPRHVSHSTLTRDRSGEYFDADCRRVDTIMRDLGHERIDLLKLDIEGAEFEVLGSLTTKPSCICVELHPVMPLGEIVEFVRGLEYDVQHLDGWNVTLARQRS